MTSSRPTLLIVGGSVRAAAGSAIRAGFHPVCADRFCDVDLQRLATVLPVRDFQRDLMRELNALPPTPWFYTGAMENEPRRIAAIRRRHKLRGNSPTVLTKVRDPFWIEKLLRATDLPVLRHHALQDSVPCDCRWLLKPKRGAGGFGIQHWADKSPRHQDAFYLQEFREGQPISALFVASPQGTQLLGLCEQQIGHAAGASTEFGYAGSLGPIDVAPATRSLVAQIGNCLAKEAALCGLFGCDFVLAEGVPWLTEVNPRYTASVEILERAFCQAFLTAHVTACEGFRPTISTCEDDVRHMRGVVGKRIVYAKTPLLAPCLEVLAAAHELFALAPAGSEPLLADIPTPGSRIAEGWPVCTLFAEAATVDECRALLASRAELVTHWLDQATP